MTEEYLVHEITHLKNDIHRIVLRVHIELNLLDLALQFAA